VGDEDDRLPFRHDRPQGIKDPVDLALAEHRGWFVQDQQLSATTEESSDLDQLLFTQWKLLEWPARVNMIQSDPPQQSAHALVELTPSDHDGFIDIAEDHVVGDGELRDDAQLLFDKSNTTALCRLDIGEAGFLSGEAKDTLVGLLGAGHHLDQSALAGAVVTTDA
jgi:hypothetical protein